jgi:hypothetical protein
MNLIAGSPVGRIGIYTLDDGEKCLLDRIKNGKEVLTPHSNGARLCQQRLVRNGLIENHGTRSRPDWRPSEKWKQDARVIIVDVEDESFWNWL